MSSNSATEEQLIERLREGDENALVELISIYRPRLKRMIEFRLDRRLRGRVDPSDVFQEAYLDATKRVTHFVEKPELPFLVWLRQITLQRMIEFHRRHIQVKKRDARAERSLDRGNLGYGTSVSLASQLVGQLTSPSQLLMRVELMQQVEESLDSMDPVDREVLALRHFEELSNNEVAEILGITKAGASNRYVRALARLRTILENVPGFFEGMQ